MSLDQDMKGQGWQDEPTPWQIAHHPLFTAREKLELLGILKAEATGLGEDGQPIAFTPEEIEEAIEEVRLEAQHGDALERRDN